MKLFFSFDWIQWTRILEDYEINALISLSSFLGTGFIFIFDYSSFSLNKNKYSNDTFTHCVFGHYSLEH